MSGTNQPTIPANLQGVGSDILITQFNTAWGEQGSGALQFWEIYTPGVIVFRDSTATSVNGGQLQALNNFYEVLALAGLQFIPRGDTEARSRDEASVGALGVTIRPTRVDSKAKPISLRKGYDPTGRIQRTILTGEMTWAMHLPQYVILNAMVNGTDLYGNTLPVSYDGQALFSANHVVNPTDKLLKSKTYSNIIQLPGPVTEADWGDFQDTMRSQAIDFDGVTLYNAGATYPLIVCASSKQAKRWMRFIGGPKVFDNFHLLPVLINGQPVGISSVSLGEAQIVVDPYIRTIANATAKTTMDLTAYVFPRVQGNRTPLIYAEEQTPQVHVSSEASYQGYNQKMIEVVSDAWVAAGFGEPRSVYQVIEKAA